MISSFTNMPTDPKYFTHIKLHLSQAQKCQKSVTKADSVRGKISDMTQKRKNNNWPLPHMENIETQNMEKIFLKQAQGWGGGGTAGYFFQRCASIETQ